MSMKKTFKPETSGLHASVLTITPRGPQGKLITTMSKSCVFKIKNTLKNGTGNFHKKLAESDQNLIKCYG